MQEGQEILTESEKARKAQEGVLEFLLVNHPLDCPVCDKGGECPLQDQALSHGPGESRFVEEKRHFAKPIEIGPLVLLDRERCIQCARCTRFSEEIAGDAMINLAFRADGVEVATFPDSPFTSYFAGNTIQICPVGASTSPAYRFRSRPWDLEQVETTCTSCAVGCRIVAQSSAGQIVRHLGIDSDPVNQSWLCDKGRYGFEAVYSPKRFSEPLVHRDDAFVPTTWHAALEEVASSVRESIERSGPESVGVIGGARLSNEDAYVWARLAKSVVRTDSVDAQVGDGLPAEVVAGLPHATIDDATKARVVVMLTGDLREELPILYLRLKLASEQGLKIIECTPALTPLSARATETIGYLPGESAALVAALLDGTAFGPARVDQDALKRARGLDRRRRRRRRRRCRAPDALRAGRHRGERRRARPPARFQRRAFSSRSGVRTRTARSTWGSRRGYCPGGSASKRRVSGTSRTGAPCPRVAGGTLPASCALPSTARSRRSCCWEPTHCRTSRIDHWPAPRSSNAVMSSLSARTKTRPRSSPTSSCRLPATQSGEGRRRTSKGG